jgi:hypothetical protein
LNEAIIVALITGGAAIISNVLTANKSSRELNFKLEKQQAVTDTKIEELTREVRAHNNFAQRMPVVENKIETLTDTVSELKKYHME